MIVESRPPGPVGCYDEDAEDEKDEDVLDLAAPHSHQQTGLAEQKTDSNTDINIPDTVTDSHCTATAPWETR